MKKTLSSMDLYYLLKELGFLIGGKIDQIYQKDKTDLTLQMHVTGHGKQLIKIFLPGMIYLSKYKGTQPPTPPGFCTFLRKRLKNARLKSIEQKGFERIIDLTYSTKDTDYHLIIELFSDGNIILCDSNYKIISPLTTGNWKDRTIRGGIEYTYPKRDLNIIDITDEDFEKTIKKSDKESIVKTLAIEFGLGGIYAEELCLLAKVDKDKKYIEDKDIKSIIKSAKTILNQEIKGIVTDKNIFPFKLTNIEVISEYPTFNEALDETLTEEKINAEADEAISRKDKEIGKIQNMLDEQNKRLKELKNKIEESTEKGNTIYNNYTEVKNALDKAKQEKEHPLIKSINKKDKTVTIEIK